MPLELSWRGPTVSYLTAIKWPLSCCFQFIRPSVLIKQANFPIHYCYLTKLREYYVGLFLVQTMVMFISQILNYHCWPFKQFPIQNPVINHGWVYNPLIKLLSIPLHMFFQHSQRTSQTLNRPCMWPHFSLFYSGLSALTLWLPHCALKTTCISCWVEVLSISSIVILTTHSKFSRNSSIGFSSRSLAETLENRN